MKESLQLKGIIACICEGSAEEAIIEVLLRHDCLIFRTEDLLEGKVLHTRSAKEFAKRYLRKEFQSPITVLRVLDSRKEQFELPKGYEDKVQIVNIITAPEIEMLIILSEGKYEEFLKQFRKSRQKPSDFCVSELKLRDVKTKQFVSEYFSDVKLLISAIQEYHRIKQLPSGEKSLFDLLRPGVSAGVSGDGSR